MQTFWTKIRADKTWILIQFDILVVFGKELSEKQNINEKAANDNKRIKKISMQKVILVKFDYIMFPTLFRISTKLSMLADKQNLSYLPQTHLHH